MTLLLLLALPLWACRHESPLPETDGDNVRLSLDVDIPDFGETGTKADFGENPSVTSLFVVVFDEAGLLSEIKKARLTGSEWSVTLKASALPRTLHFLTYGREDDSRLASLLGDKVDESVFAELLAYEDGDAICWARFYLSTGIGANTVLPTVRLVRNYAKVLILNEAEHFELEAFRVVNAARFGMAVPFKGLGLGNTGGFDLELFPDFYDYDADRLCTYAEVTANGYRGYPHPAGLLRTPTTENIDAYSDYLLSDGDGVDDGVDYIFESRYNPETGNDNAYILLKGKYNGGASTWYKADFVYEDASSASGWGRGDRIPYDIIRNFAYVLTIEAVANDGYATPGEAASRPAFNNLDGSVIGIDINSLHDLGSSLYLSHTAVNLSRNEGGAPVTTSVDLYYRNLLPRNAASPSNTPGTDVLITVSGDSILSDGVVNSDGTLNTDYYSVVSESVTITAANNPLHLQEGDWWHLCLPVTTTDSGNATLQQTITFKNRNGLSRSCVLYLRPHYPFEIVGYRDNPLIVRMNATEPAGGDLVRVNFRIPDGLPQTLFPIEFKVESYADGSTGVSKQVLQPNAAAITQYETSLGSGDFRIELPVSGNTATIVGENEDDPDDLGFPSYHFVRTLTWAEYARAAADNNMKTFPVFLQPTYSPRDPATVAALGTTTVWMRQGERYATFFDYRDENGRSTRRLAYRMAEVVDTRFILPPGDETFDGKPVYRVPMGAPLALEIQLVRDDNDNPAPNPVTLSKGGVTQFSFDPASGDGGFTTTVTALEYTGEKYLVTADAATLDNGSAIYGDATAQFYIQPGKGLRTVTFPDEEVVVLKNQTVYSTDNTNLQASATPELNPGAVLTYSLSNSTDPVLSNSYAAISQTGSRLAFTGLAVTEGEGIDLWAIAGEDSDFDRSAGSRKVRVKQGVITQTGWYTGATSASVGALIPITGTVSYDELYSPSSLPFSDANIGFISSDESVATVERREGNWYIVPRSTGTVTLTMQVYGTDDGVFETATFTQTMTVGAGWWKVIGGTIESGGLYAVSDASDAALMKNEVEYHVLMGRNYWKIDGESFTPRTANGGAYFSGNFAYGFTVDIDATSGRYALHRGNAYLYPYGHTIAIGTESNDNDCLRLLSGNPPSNRTRDCWSVTNDGATAFSVRTYSSNQLQSRWITYANDSHLGMVFGQANTSSSTLHFWRKCETLSDVIECGYSAGYYLFY